MKDIKVARKRLFIREGVDWEWFEPSQDAPSEELDNEDDKENIAKQIILRTNEQLFGEKSRSRQPIPAPRVLDQYPQMSLEK